MKRCVTTTHLGVFGNSQGVLGKHTLFKSVCFMHSQGHKSERKRTAKIFVGFHNLSTILTMPFLKICGHCFIIQAYDIDINTYADSRIEY